MAETTRDTKHAYFNQYLPCDWDVLGYLKHSILQSGSMKKSPNMKDTYDLAIDSYLKQLEYIVDNQETSDTSRKKARELIESYRQRNVCYISPAADYFDYFVLEYTLFPRAPGTDDLIGLSDTDGDIQVIVQALGH